MGQDEPADPREAEVRGEGIGDRLEPRGGDHDGGSTHLLEFDGVVHAVGSAAPAVGHARDDQVRLGDDPIENVRVPGDGGVGRHALRALLRHQRHRRSGAGGQSLGQPGEDQHGVRFPVVQNGDAEPAE